MSEADRKRYGFDDPNFEKEFSENKIYYGKQGWNGVEKNTVGDAFAQTVQLQDEVFSRVFEHTWIWIQETKIQSKRCVRF